MTARSATDKSSKILKESVGKEQPSPKFRARAAAPAAARRFTGREIMCSRETRGPGENSAVDVLGLAWQAVRLSRSVPIPA